MAYGWHPVTVPAEATIRQAALRPVSPPCLPDRDRHADRT